MCDDAAAGGLREPLEGAGRGDEVDARVVCAPGRIDILPLAICAPAAPEVDEGITALYAERARCQLGAIRGRVCSGVHVEDGVAGPHAGQVPLGAELGGELDAGSALNNGRIAGSLGVHLGEAGCQESRAAAVVLKGHEVIVSGGHRLLDLACGGKAADVEQDLTDQHVILGHHVPVLNAVDLADPCGCGLLGAEVLPDEHCSGHVGIVLNREAGAAAEAGRCGVVVEETDDIVLAQIGHILAGELAVGAGGAAVHKDDAARGELLCCGPCVGRAGVNWMEVDEVGGTYEASQVSRHPAIDAVALEDDVGCCGCCAGRRHFLELCGGNFLVCCAGLLCWLGGAW